LKQTYFFFFLLLRSAAVKNKGVVAGNCDNGSNSDDRGKM